jgi:hypothetical protein
VRLNRDRSHMQHGCVVDVADLLHLVERPATSLRTYALAKSRTRTDNGCPPSFRFLEKYRRIVPWLALRSPAAWQCAVTSQQSESKSKSAQVRLRRLAFG